MLGASLSFAVSSAILALASFFCVFLMLQKVSFVQSLSKPIIPAMTGFILIGITAVFNTIRYGFHIRSVDTWENISTTIAFFVAPPLFTLALVSIGWQKICKPYISWSVFFTSCILFFLAKWLGCLNFYSALLITSLLLVNFGSVISAPFRHSSSTFFLIVAIFSYALSLLVVSFLKSSFVFMRLDFFNYFTALGNLFLASGFFQLMRKGALQSS